MAAFQARSVGPRSRPRRVRTWRGADRRCSARSARRRPDRRTEGRARRSGRATGRPGCSSPIRTWSIDPQDLGVGHIRVQHDLDTRVHQRAVPMPEGGRRIGRRGLSGGDEPDLHATQRRCVDAFQDRPVRDVRVDDMDHLGGVREGSLDGVADRVMPRSRDVPQDRRRGRGAGRRRRPGVSSTGKYLASSGSSGDDRRRCGASVIRKTERRAGRRSVPRPGP